MLIIADNQLVKLMINIIYTPLCTVQQICYDVDVVKLRAQANASMPASYNSNIQLLILISNNNSDFRFHEFRL